MKWQEKQPKRLKATTTKTKAKEEEEKKPKVLQNQEVQPVVETEKETVDDFKCGVDSLETKSHEILDVSLINSKSIEGELRQWNQKRLS